MDRALAEWILLVLLGALAAVLHLALVWKVLRTREMGLPRRLLALVPPAAPVVGWVAGHRRFVVIWAIAVVGYALWRATSATLAP